MSGKIEHVSDTAFWVATFRALESERPDAIFRDPLAGVLAGERGRAIARNMPNRDLMSFVMVVRTSAIDRLIMSAIERGVDTVLNLGAGLDTRPYRMPLPKALRWIEADFPPMIAHKNDTLAAEQPVCSLERVAIDLSDRSARQALFRRVANDARCVLVITEGVIPYLQNDEVERLAQDVRAEAKLQYWIQDYYSVEARRHRRGVRRKMQAAPFVFSAPDWFAFFARCGFQPLERVTIVEEAMRIQRRPPFMFPLSLFIWLMPVKWREKAGNAAGYTLLERAHA
jgi:methyltransferase (TIGR00027 family)